MNYTVTQKVELAFWDTIIYILDEVKPIQVIVQTVYRNYKDGSLRRLAAATLQVAVAGLLSGISLFLLISLIP